MKRACVTYPVTFTSRYQVAIPVSIRFTSHETVTSVPKSARRRSPHQAGKRTFHAANRRSPVRATSQSRHRPTAKLRPHKARYTFKLSCLSPEEHEWFIFLRLIDAAYGTGKRFPPLKELNSSKP